MEKRNIIVPLEGGEKVHWQILKRFEFENILQIWKKESAKRKTSKKKSNEQFENILNFLRTFQMIF